MEECIRRYLYYFINVLVTKTNQAFTLIYNLVSTILTYIQQKENNL